MTPFAPFDYNIDKANAGSRWEKWLRKLENLLVGMKLTDENRKRAMSEMRCMIFMKPREATLTKRLNTSSRHISSPRETSKKENFNFRTCKQKANQSLDYFVTELRQLAKNCNFTNTNAEILSQVIQHCKSSRIRKRALSDICRLQTADCFVSQ